MIDPTSGKRSWAQSYGSTGTDVMTRVASDDSGNVYVAGYAASGITLMSTTLTHTSTMMIVAKIGSTGTMSW
jgi:hypothetical protein